MRAKGGAGRRVLLQLRALSPRSVRVVRECGERTGRRVLRGVRPAARRVAGQGFFVIMVVSFIIMPLAITFLCRFFMAGFSIASCDSLLAIALSAVFSAALASV